MQRKKRLTKRELKERSPAAAQQNTAHIHCIACGRHLDADEFDALPPSAKYLTCQHQSSFPSCVSCEVTSRGLIADHDRTGKPIQQAQAWH